MATNKEFVNEVKDVTQETKDTFKKTEENGATAADMETFKEAFKAAGQLAGESNNLLSFLGIDQDKKTDSDNFLKSLWEAALDDMENGVIDSDDVGKDPETIKAEALDTLNTSLDETLYFIDGLNERMEELTEKMEAGADQEEIDQLKNDIITFGEAYDKQSAVDSVNSLKQIYNAIPDDMKEALQYYGFTSLLKNIVSDTLEPGTPDDSENEVNAFINLIQSARNAAASAGEQLTPPVHLTQRGIMDDRLINELLKGEIKPSKMKGEKGKGRYVWGVDQAPKNSKKQVPVFIGMTGKDGAPIKTSRYIEPDDVDILETAGSIIIKSLMQGEKFPISITPAEIWRQQNGIDDHRITPSPAQQNEVLDRMDKMRFTELYMDLTAEAKENYIDQLQDDRIKNGIVSTYFIEADYKKIRTEKNRLFDAYSFKDMPFLLKYNIAKGHMMLIDADLMDTSDTTDRMDGVGPFRRYLVTQIELMYRHKRNSTIILFDTIYKDGGIKTPEEKINAAGKEYANETARAKAIRQTAGADRRKICAVLDSWKKRRYILDYSLVKKGNKYTGVQIKLNPKKYKSAPGEKLESWTDQNGRLLKELI